MKHRKLINNSKSKKTILLLVCLFIFQNLLTAQGLEKYRWKAIETTGDATGRHENAFIEFDGKFYLIGGRGVNPVNVFDPQSHTWSELGSTPMEIHHFQAVVYDSAIYVLGRMTGKYPKEVPLENIWIYYPQDDTWKKGPRIPQELRRGGAGVVVYENQFYMVCGIEFGHTSGTNNLFTSYDPETNRWTSLTKAPTVRDHFSAVVIDNKLYCIGGRNTSIHEPDNFSAFFGEINPYVDVYDFYTKKWQTLNEKLPVPTAAAATVCFDGHILYMGGESSQEKAHSETQCLDVKTGKWKKLDPLVIGRHGSHAVVYDGRIYVAAGSPNRGGGNMGSIEVFSVD